MLRRRIGRPSLLGLAARTTVVAGAATVTAGAIKGRQARRADEQNKAQADEQAQQAQTAPTAVSAAPQAGSGGGLTAKISELADMHASGVLTDEEFSAAKARLLAT